MKEKVKNYIKVVIFTPKLRYTWSVIFLSVFLFVYGITDTSQPLGNPVWAFAVVSFFIAFMYLFAWLRWGSIHYEGFMSATEALEPFLEAEKGTVILFEYPRPMDYHGVSGDIPIDRYFMAGTSLGIKDFHKKRKAA